MSPFASISARTLKVLENAGLVNERGDIDLPTLRTHLESGYIARFRGYGQKTAGELFRLCGMEQPAKSTRCQFCGSIIKKP